jgi:hypothetical protein
MKIQVVVFWVVTPCNDVVDGSKVVLVVGIAPHNPEIIYMNLKRRENFISRICINVSILPFRVRLFLSFLIFS